VRLVTGAAVQAPGELEAAVRAMRAAQKAFFASAPGSPERRAALDRSRELEARVDALLEPGAAPAAQAPAQEDLFAGSSGPAAPKPRRGGAWCDGPLAALDFETTGPDPFTARPVTYARVLLDAEDRVTLEESRLVWAGEPVPAEAEAVHGISTARAQAEGIPVEACVRELYTWLMELAAARIPLVIFNARFDYTLLLAEGKRLGLASIPRPLLVDPTVLDRELDRFRKGKRKLVDVCAHYGVTLEHAHEAGADAVAAARLARRLAFRHPMLSTFGHAALMEFQAKAFEKWRVGLNTHWRKTGNASRISPGWPLAEPEGAPND
jgi:DNA polymerase-3 subunit epsilon